MALSFAKHLLDIGNGRFPVNTDGKITLNPEIACTVDSAEALIDAVYPNISSEYGNREWLSDRALLAPLNKTVDDLNVKIMAKIPGKPFFSLIFSIQ